MNFEDADQAFSIQGSSSKTQAKIPWFARRMTAQNALSHKLTVVTKGQDSSPAQTRHQIQIEEVESDNSSSSSSHKSHQHPLGTACDESSDGSHEITAHERWANIKKKQEKQV